MGDTGWKILFAVAAGFNFAIGLPMLLAPDRMVAAFGIAPQPTLIFVQFTGGLVAIFGLYYGVVARSLARREIVWLGIVGKLFAVGILTAYFLAGLIPAQAFSLGLSDLVFVCLFLWFLFGGRKQPAQ
jgi:hypothetical protein